MKNLIRQNSRMNGYNIIIDFSPAYISDIDFLSSAYLPAMGHFPKIKYLKAIDYTTCYYMDIWNNIVNIMGPH
jgi:hypothetical protein